MKIGQKLGKLVRESVVGSQLLGVSCRAADLSVCYNFKLPNKGIASLVAGIVSARTCENTVRDSRIVTPEIVGKKKN